MSPAEIVATMREAFELARQVCPYASIAISGQPEALVRQVAEAAGVEPTVNFYPGHIPTVIVVARPPVVGLSFGHLSFASASRAATAEEIASQPQSLPRPSSAPPEPKP